MPDGAAMTPMQQAVIALQAQRARITELEQAARTPIAIVGMACRYPADSTSTNALWQAVSTGRDGSCEVPPERWNIDDVFDPTPGRPGKMYVRRSCFISGVDQFEPLFFRISPREAVGIDPQQRLLLEVTWEALEDAAIPPPSLVGSPTGVFVGISTNDYSALLSRTAHGSGSNATAGAGNAASVASGRLSYTFGFQGPCLAVDTACSSSLVATHLAVQALRNRECRLAVVAGVNLMLTPDITVNFCQGRMLSPDGLCKTFDASADGYVRGEGCGVVLLKRLPDAVADGDRILAVVRGSALNQDGRSAGLTAPNGLAQEAVIRAALANAGVRAEDIDYIEAHGTGTALGDPIEMHALKSVFAGRTRPLHVGSVKTNIGHAEAAAGVAGLIKAVLMLQHQMLPPHPHFRQLNPHIDLSGINIRIPTEPTPQPLSFAGVSSFGFSGTNAHIVLEAAPAAAADTQPSSGETRLLISARTKEALEALVARYSTYLANTTDSFADICHTAATGRARLPWWVAVSAPSELETAQPANTPLPAMPETSGRKVALPTVAFQRQRCWIDTPANTTTMDAVEPEDQGLHPLLGRRLSLPFSTETRWQAAITSRHPALGFLAHHAVNGAPTMPASCFVEIGLAAFPGAALADLRITAPLRIAYGAGRLVQTIITPEGTFSIVSSCADGSDAMTHVTGRSVPRSAGPPETVPITPAGTAVDTAAFYAAMEKRGVTHGPEFRLLDEIRRDDGVATATLRAAGVEDRFTLHPARLDAAFQLAAAALPDIGDDVMMPAGIDQVVLHHRPAADAAARVTARRDQSGVTADIVVADAAGLAFEIRGLIFRAAAGPANRLPFYRLEWRAKPLTTRLTPPAFLPALSVLAGALANESVRLADLHGMAGYSRISRGLEDAASGYVVRALRSLGLRFRPGAEFTFGAMAESLGVADRHTRLLRRLLQMLQEDGILSVTGRRYRVLAEPPEADPDADTSALIEQAPGMAGEIGVLRRCGEALASVLTGNTEPLSLLFPSDGEGAGAFYETSPYARTVNGLLAATAEHLTAARPRGRVLRILEVGAGTGGATVPILAAIPRPARYYVFTDLSTGFLAAAQQRFAGEELETRLLDIERSPHDQGFAEASFDVVLAANVLHATRDLRESLDHIRSLLAPGGLLLLIESTEPRRWVDIIFGLTEGWWRFADAGLRPDHPLLTLDRWHTLLAECGFETIAGSSAEVIVARRADAPVIAEDGIATWHVTGDQTLAEHLTAAGQRVTAAGEARNWVHVLPPTPRDETAQVALFAGLAAVVRDALAVTPPPRLVLVGGDSLGHAGVAGFVRTLAIETPALRPRLFIAPPSSTALVDELVAADDETEVAWDSSGARVSPRLMPGAPPVTPAVSVEGAWLITGGRGGVSQAIANWLASHGARSIILLSRQTPEQVPDLGIPVHLRQGDAADTDLIAQVLREHAIDGVIHAAGVLSDAPVQAQTEDTIRAVAHAKIGGALALDRTTREHPVRHFVFCASVAGVLGSARQANHAFCSAYLDALAGQRRAEGLPAISLDWGVWSGVGSAATLGFDARADQLGLGSIAPPVGGELFGEALGSAQSQLLVLPSVDWRRFTAHFEQGPPALLRELMEVHPAPAVSRPTDSAAPDLQTELSRIVGRCLGLTGDVDPETPLHDLGLDSLVAVEIRNQVENQLGLAVSVRDLIEGATIRSLVEAHPAQVQAPAAVPARRQIVPDLANRGQPFPLTDMQQAYWLGRRNDLVLGSVSCYLYTEFDTSQVDIDRAEAAWNQLIRRHGMLRAVIRPDGTQQILDDVPEYRFKRLDLRGQPAQAELDRLRRSLPLRVAPPSAWPLFDIRVTLFEDKARLHMGFDLIALDAASIHSLRREWARLYDNPSAALPPIGLNFRDVVLEQIAYRETDAWRQHEAYWKDRAHRLPGPPDLPLVSDPQHSGRQRFQRRRTIIDASTAAALRHQAQAHALTLPSLLATAYTDVLAAWSRTQHFCITVTSFNRPSLHPDIATLLGDFTGTILLEVDARVPRFAERAAALARQLAADLEHAEFSGIQVLREIARQTASAAPYVPVVFTSALGFRRAPAEQAPESASAGWDQLGTTVYNVSSTPQVLIDHQISEEDGNLLCNWDVADQMFPPSVVEQMVAAHEALLHALAEGSGWDRPVAALLPDLPRAPFAVVPPPEMLHAAFERQARETPRRVALVAPDAELDYGVLDTAATLLAARLLSRLDTTRDRLVAISFPKSWRQIVAVLAVLKAGAAYLPVDPGLPRERRRLLIERGEAIVLGDPGELDEALALARNGAALPSLPTIDDPHRLAYVIYTSGSTGQPKGVMIEHAAALTTVREVNRRWKVGCNDRVLGLSSLSFDLSVYDIFGPLSVGGALVLPSADASRDPSHWGEMLIHHRVTIWNSVPALMAMQAEYGLPTGHHLRLVLLSGDWVPVELATRLKEQSPSTAVVALGGATEAAIWSNAHEIGALDPEWPSIPYGMPLAGHMLHVVNERAEACPDWVIGEIEISGNGIARGYWCDPDQSAERFRIDPLTGERRYRTGDLGRFRPYAAAARGTPTPIEFLGREDSQVKVQGYRIELGEVEAALATHPAVTQAVVTAPATANHGERTLHGFVVPHLAVSPTGDDPRWDRLLAVARDAAAEDERKVSRDDFELTAAMFSEQAAAAAAAAVRRLTGSYSLPSVDELIERHGVSPRYRAWLERMLPEVARVGMAAEPASSHAISDVDRIGFDCSSLDFLDRVITALPELLSERTHSASVYLSEETPDVYGRLFAIPNRVIGMVVRALAAEPAISVLEVGGGLGTTLAAIEPVLPAGRVTWLFTDISQHLLRMAMARFPDRPWLSFGTLDLDTHAPLHDGRFDVIVASSTLHAAPDVGRALRHLRSYLKPGGLLIALEQTRFWPWFDLSMGLQSGFDSRTDLTLRPRHPLLSRTGWLEQLTAAGFGRAEVATAEGTIDDMLGFDVILARSGVPAGTGQEDSAIEQALRAHLADRLPAYMVPRTITLIDRVPLSANGKVDRRALVAPAVRAPMIPKASDRLEQEAAAVVAQIMQLDHVDPSRSLFELGATSLTLVALQRVLAEHFGRVVPLQRIFDEPTVAAFAAEMADRSAASSALVTFDARAGGKDDRPKLVMMPGIFSLPFYLREMAEATAADVAIVSVQLPGMADGEVPIDSVEGQAEYAVNRIKMAGLEPPYLIGGHSFGGRVAIEAARMLRDEGHAVPLLVLGDTVRTYTELADFQTDEMAYIAMTRGLYALYGRLTRVPYEALEDLPPEEKFHRTASRMQKEGLFGALDLPLDRMVSVFKANFRAIGRFKPGPIPGDMAVIRTEGGFPAEFFDYESGDALKDRALGWSDLVQGKIDVRIMPGDHLAMLDPANLPVMADILSELVRDALARHLRETYDFDPGPDATPIALNREIISRRAAVGGKHPK